MIRVRRARERGQTQTSWLDSRHTFSFGDYHDPQQMGFRHLRVINEDRVTPGAGFGTHSHRDMEIITYVLDGALAHKDSTGTSSVIRVGDVQRMSAGTGISHSEYNASKSEPVHFLQIWILPAETGLKPGYEQRSYDLQGKNGSWVRVAARDGRDGAVKIHQDVELLLAFLPNDERLDYSIQAGRHAWLQVIRGTVLLNDETLEEGDGAAISEEKSVKIVAVDSAEILLFDLA